jgi:hypothetical protein
VRVPSNPDIPRRYGSIAALVRVLPARQLMPFWLAIGLTFAALGFLMDVMARGRSAPLTLALNVFFVGVVAVALVWARMTGRRRTSVAVGVVYALYILLASRLLHSLPATPPGRLFLDGIGAMFALMGGYMLFIHFINSSASRYLRARTEIELARDIHRVLVPPIDRRIGDVEFYGWSFPSGEVGGDLVDLVEHEGGWLGYVADVSGHGVASGVVMGMFKSALRARLLSGAGLAALLADLNAILIPLKPSTSFITVAGVRASGTRIECAVAGHHPVLRVRGTQVDEITPPQMAVGMFPDATFEATVVEWQPGDLLALVTDGLLEVFDTQDRELGLTGARQVLAAHHDRPLAEIAERLLAGARAHGPQLDDQTVLLIRRMGVTNGDAIQSRLRRSHTDGPDAADVQESRSLLPALPLFRRAGPADQLRECRSPPVSPAFAEHGVGGGCRGGAGGSGPRRAADGAQGPGSCDPPGNAAADAAGVARRRLYARPCVDTAAVGGLAFRERRGACRPRAGRARRKAREPEGHQAVRPELDGRSPARIAGRAWTVSA